MALHLSAKHEFGLKFLYGIFDVEIVVNNQRNQWLGCVIRPGTMAGLIVGSRLDAAGLKIWLHAIFEDGFID